MLTTIRMHLLLILLPEKFRHRKKTLLNNITRNDLGSVKAHVHKPLFPAPLFAVSSFFPLLHD